MFSRPQGARALLQFVVLSSAGSHSRTWIVSAVLRTIATVSSEMSPLAPTIKSINVGGLAVDVFSMSWQTSDRDDVNNNRSSDSTSNSIISPSSLPIAALVLLHGRLSTKEALRPIAERALHYASEQMARTTGDVGASISHELIVVSLVSFTDLIAISSRPLDHLCRYEKWVTQTKLF